MNPPKELLGVFGCFFHSISVDQAHDASLFGISFKHWLKSASVFWSAYCLRIRHLFHLLFSFLFTLKTVSMFQSPCWPVQLLLSNSQRLLHTGTWLIDIEISLCPAGLGTDSQQGDHGVSHRQRRPTVWVSAALVLHLQASCPFFWFCCFVSADWPLAWNWVFFWPLCLNRLTNCLKLVF